MTLNSRTTRWSLILFATLAFLVISAMTWASVVTVKLTRADQRAKANTERNQRIRLAVTEIENWANQLLFYEEFSREYWQYASFRRFNEDEVRLPGGELLTPGAVGASPLFLDPPKHPWLMLHFQVSPHSGFSSPQLAPDLIRRWPGFTRRDDSWDRSVFARRLVALESVFGPDELADLYRQSRYIEPIEPDSELIELNDTRIARLATDQSRQRPGRDIALRRNRANRMQLVQRPRAVCAPEQIAYANIFLPDQFDEQLSSSDASQQESEVGIVCGPMRPTWIRLPGRTSDDLMYLRPVSAASQTAWQGFIVDWNAFRSAMLEQIAGIFEDASISPLRASQAAPSSGVAFGVIPAQLLVKPSASAAPFQWNRTYTFLLIGWAGAITVLGAVGLGLISTVRLSERRSHFAYAVTHELRTPLTTFRLYTDMLTEGLVRPEDQATYLKTLNEESKRLADLVNGVLEYSRIENNSLPINKETVRIADFLDSVNASYRRRCESADMELKIDVNGLADKKVVTDKQLAVQIVGNLIDNACKYGRNGDQPVVEVCAGQVDGKLEIRVRDYGPGVPPQKRSSIFKPYNRAEAEPATSVGGVGLGLALSKSWARLLGGQLELLHDPKRRGATFRVSLGPIC